MTNTAKHTPGPWVVEGSDITNGYPDQGSRILIAEKVAIESDAHLIAAAPAMYEALKGMLEWARRIKQNNPGPEVMNALKAIAQAEGRQ